MEWQGRHQVVCKSVYEIIDQIGGWITDGVGQTHGEGHPLEVYNKRMINALD